MTLLAKLDNLQLRFLSHLQISEECAFLSHNLLPLAVRRNISMLGLLHKIQLGQARKDWELLFPFATHGHFYSTRHARRRHTRQFCETSGKTNAYNRSLFAMVRIYNILPQDYVDATSVSDFQSLLTSEVRKRCGGGLVGWEVCFRTDHSSFNVVSETHFKSLKK